MFIPNTNTLTNGFNKSNLMNGNRNLKISDQNSAQDTEVLEETNNIVKSTGDSAIHNNFFEQIYKSTPEAILILDENNIVIDSNPSFEKLFLFKNHEIKGRFMEEHIVPDHFQDESKDMFDKINCGENVQKESIRTKRDGRLVNVLITGCRIKLSENKYGSYLIYIDISKHKRSEEQMRSSLVEKEVLIREIHHRVKNNLQIISSLLHIQSSKITSDEMVSMFTNCQNRVKSIALIHEKLYQTNSFTRVDFGSYTKNLTYYLFRMFDVKSDTVTLKLNVENVFLPMDTAIPCGLIINELVTNSLKHAFSGEKRGEIVIETVYHSNNKFTLTIKDNGKGLPEEVDFNKSRTVGFNLINSLVRQLGGSLKINCNEGTEFNITFSILNQ
jgi:PAS domain S-box-containing protein